MSTNYTAAQKKAFGVRMAKARAAKAKAGTVKGRGAYTYAKKRPVARRTYVKGRGNYTKSAGYRIGAAVGGPLGYGAQHLIKHITGFGDYSITANSLMGPAFDPPELHNPSKDAVCVRHREYICDINASNLFTLQQFPINPGLETTFPWLSSVASAFEQYKISGMIFEFKTLSADYTTAASAALGSVIMGTQYNSLSPPFPDKKTFENYSFANSSKPSETFISPVECKKSLSPVEELYVRTGTPTTGDLRLYDLGNFQIATMGNTGTGVIGELWCTYQIEFYKPKLLSAIGYELLSDHWFNATSGDVAGSTPLGGPTHTLIEKGSNAGTFISGASNNHLNFPLTQSDGTYLIVYQTTGTSAAITAPILTTNNVTFTDQWVNDTATNVNNGGSTSSVYIQSFIAEITAAPAFVVFGVAGTLPTTVTSMDLWVTQINGGITT